MMGIAPSPLGPGPLTRPYVVDRHRRPIVSCAAAVIVTAGAWGAATANLRAHPFEVTEVDVSFARDGTFTADITFHVDAMIAEVPLGDLDEGQYAQLRALPREEIARRLELVRRYFLIMTELRFDGAPVTPTVSFPNLEDARSSGAVRLPGHLVRLRGRVPAEARTFVFVPSPVFNLVVLRIRQEGQDGVFEEIVRPVEESPPFRLGLNLEPPGRLSVAAQYVHLGFEHILPKGLDHILFVLGLYLLSIRLGPLLWQVTAFTAAHTMTLALSMYGVVSLRPSIVEPLIAVSIAYVAVENLMTSELKPWRPFIVFGFGLLHGLGFAGVLRDLGLPSARFVTALVSFNLGVELGQVSVIALAFLAVGRLRRWPWYRGYVVVPASLAIACIGVFWAFERVRIY